MPLCIEKNAEPIPGYRLIERLGKGGFGEVWRAEAPGGLPKAIKFVHGDTRKVDEDGSHRAEQELRAIQRVQDIRHPYLLSIERYDVVDGRLVIVTELADCNLFDRFEYHRNKGLAGIPRMELLRYLREAAEALDLLNREHQLQHLDVKPQNIFLIHDHVKVADFGLVKGLAGLRTDVTEERGGTTPVYAAPETFDCIITPSCDQYSLAIVYQELLTGNRPFTGNNIQQLVTQHLQASPNLASLPYGDRPAIARALAKKPENRHASCMALVEALELASVVPTAPRTAARVADDRPNGRRTPNLFESIRRLELKDAKPYRPETPPTMIRVRREDMRPTVVDQPPPRTAPPEFTGNGVLFPAIVIGLGRGGMLALRRMRTSFVDRFGGMSALPNIRLLLIDSDTTTTDESLRDSAGPLDTEEVLLMRLNRASHYLKPRRNGRSLIDGWFDPQWLYRIPRNPAVQGQRALGRLTFGDHYIPFVDRLDKLIEDVTGPDSLLRADCNTTLGIRTNRPRIYVVTGIGGGTGGGMFLDVAFAARHRLRFFGYDHGDVTGILMLPEVNQSTPTQITAVGNAYAALTELVHFHHAEASYRCTFDDRDVPFDISERPFSRVAVIPWEPTAPVGSTRDGPVQAATLITTEVSTELGRSVDDLRTERLRGSQADDKICAMTYGYTVMSCPRKALMRDASGQLCRKMVMRWTDRSADSIVDAVEKRMDAESANQHLKANDLAARLFQSTIEILGQQPEQYFASLSKAVAPKGWFSGIDLQLGSGLLSRFDEFLGRPEAGTSPSPSGLLGDALLATADAVVKDWNGRLAQLAVTLIEQPEYRLSGAEVAVKTLRTRFQETAQKYGEVADDLGDKAAKAYPRLQALLHTSTGRRGAAEFVELAQRYPLWRYHSMLHRQVADVAQTLANDLSDQLGEIGFCRQRLEELLQTFGAPGEGLPFNANDLFPSECGTAQDAAAGLLAGITEMDYRELDCRMQKMIQSQFTALVHVCLSTSNMLAGLEPAMLKLSQQFLSGRIGEAGSADLFFERYRHENQAIDAIQTAFESAVPALSETVPSLVSEVGALSFPAGPAGDRIKGLVQRFLADKSLRVISGIDQITFYRELPMIPLAHLPQMGREAQECFETISQRDHGPPHTRSDVECWLGANS